MFAGCSLKDKNAVIVGEWEAEYLGVAHSLICYKNGTGEAGGEGMESIKIRWDVCGDEFKLIPQEYKDKNKGFILLKLIDNELVASDPSNPEIGVLKFKKKNANPYK
jgi:hypothetical protein